MNKLQEYIKSREIEFNNHPCSTALDNNHILLACSVCKNTEFVCKSHMRDFHYESLNGLLEAVVGMIERKKETKNVRDRSIIGSGSLRYMMTGVHSEEKKNLYNKALSDLAEDIKQSMK